MNNSFAGVSKKNAVRSLLSSFGDRFRRLSMCLAAANNFTNTLISEENDNEQLF